MRRMIWVLILTGTQAVGQISIGNRAGIGLFDRVLKADEEVEDFWMRDQVQLLAPSIMLPVEIRLSKCFALQPELGFVQRGSRYETDYGTSTFQVNSVEVGLLAKGFWERGRWKPYAFAGPMMNRAMSVRSHFAPSSNGTSGASQDAVRSADDYPMKVAQVSVAAGAGVALRIGVPWLFLDYRRIWGVTPTMEIDFIDVNFNVLKDGRLFDRGHIISMGILIPLNRSAWGSPSDQTERPTGP